MGSDYPLPTPEMARKRRDLAPRLVKKLKL